MTSSTWDTVRGVEFAQGGERQTTDACCGMKTLRGGRAQRRSFLPFATRPSPRRRVKTTEQRGTSIALVLKRMRFTPFFSKGLTMYAAQSEAPLVDCKQRSACVARAGH
jgi:hypothetical protein